MTSPIKPARGGFLRPFGCGVFIRDFLLGKGPHGAPFIVPQNGAPQADIFYHYKQALRRITAEDRATRQEEKRAQREQRAINPDNIEDIAKRYLARMPYKAQGCRYHSFVVYFSNLTRLGWVEPTGEEKPSSFQEHYPPGQPRRYFRLTETGKSVPDDLWANPHKALYG